MVQRIVVRVENAAMAPSSGHAVHEYPEALLKEVHEDPYRIIYQYTEKEFWVVTIVHFKEVLDPKRLATR